MSDQQVYVTNDRNESDDGIPRKETGKRPVPEIAAVLPQTMNPIFFIDRGREEGQVIRTGKFEAPLRLFVGINVGKLEARYKIASTLPLFVPKGNSTLSRVS